MARNTAFHAVLANNAYVVSCYYHNGSTTTPYKGDDLERALSVYVKYADVNRKVSKTSAPLYDVTLYQSGEKAMHDIVHDFPASKENFSN
jgi:hypothetical protein